MEVVYQQQQAIAYDDTQEFYQPFDTVNASEGGRLPPPTTVYNLYKTKLCKNWSNTGSCPYGWKCQFAHGNHEMRQRAPVVPANVYGQLAGYRIYTAEPRYGYNQANIHPSLVHYSGPLEPTGPEVNMEVMTIRTDGSYSPYATVVSEELN